MSDMARRAVARNTPDARNSNAITRQQRATFAREMAELEFSDRSIHRGVGALTRSYQRFGEAGRRL